MSADAPHEVRVAVVNFSPDLVIAEEVLSPALRRLFEIAKLYTRLLLVFISILACSDLSTECAQIPKKRTNESESIDNLGCERIVYRFSGKPFRK